MAGKINNPIISIFKMSKIIRYPKKITVTLSECLWYTYFFSQDMGLEKVKDELKKKIPPLFPEYVQPEFKDNM